LFLELSSSSFFGFLTLFYDYSVEGDKDSCKKQRVDEYLQPFIRYYLGIKIVEKIEQKEEVSSPVGRIIALFSSMLLCMRSARATNFSKWLVFLVQVTKPRLPKKLFIIDNITKIGYHNII